jgi:hypothetical protein
MLGKALPERLHSKLLMVEEIVEGLGGPHISGPTSQLIYHGHLTSNKEVPDRHVAREDLVSLVHRKV